MYDKIECPYCFKDFEVDTDDGAHYKDGESEEDQCPNCDKRIMITASCLWSWEAEKADCLNGSPHQWTQWDTYWIGESVHKGEFYERHSCNSCNKEEFEWHVKRFGTNNPSRFDDN